MEHPPKQGLKQTDFTTHKVVSPSFNGTSTKTRIETEKQHNLRGIHRRVLMEHPPKQGLKPYYLNLNMDADYVLMEHPPKQGLKLKIGFRKEIHINGFNGTSTKTRIETYWKRNYSLGDEDVVLMEHPPKQGLKLLEIYQASEQKNHVLMEHPPKQGLKQ